MRRDYATIRDGIVVWAVVALVAAILGLLSSPAKAGGCRFGGYSFGRGYSVRGGCLYRSVPYTTSYSYQGRTYSKPAVKQEKVLSYDDDNWQEKLLDILEEQKKRESFYKALELLGAKDALAPSPSRYNYGGQAQTYAGQGGAAYPSATGNTFGAFSSYQYSRYGAATPFDVNRANDQAQAGADAFTRMASEANRLSGNTFQYAGQLQQINQERVGAVAELQETRATVKELADGMNRMTLGFAQALQSMKPKDSESLSIERGRVEGGSSYGEDRWDGQGPARPSEEAPRSTPRGPLSGYPPNYPPSHEEPPTESVGALKRNCLSCHNPDDPQAGLDLTATLSPAQYGALVIRMQPDAPEYRADGKTPYRMPPGKDIPVDERQVIVREATSLVEKP